MKQISVDFDEIERIIERYRKASAELNTSMAKNAPESVEAGEASNAVAAVLIALMEGGGMLAQYGTGLAAEADEAVGELQSFDSNTASALAEFSRALFERSR